MRSRIARAMDLFSDGRYFRLRLFFEGIVAGLGTGLVISLFRFLLELTDGWIIIHLGMSGSLRILPEELPAEKHDHVDLVMSNGKVGSYREY